MQMFKYFSSAVTAKSIILILFSDNSFTNWSSDLTRVLSDYIFDDAAYAGARADQGGPRLPGEEGQEQRGHQEVQGKGQEQTEGDRGETAEAWLWIRFHLQCCGSSLKNVVQKLPYEEFSEIEKDKTDCQGGGPKLLDIFFTIAANFLAFFCSYFSIFPSWIRNRMQNHSPGQDHGSIGSAPECLDSALGFY